MTTLVYKDNTVSHIDCLQFNTMKAVKDFIKENSQEDNNDNFPYGEVTNYIIIDAKYKIQIGKIDKT